MNQVESIPHPAPPVVVVVGPRGSGKSTIGRLLAERLERPWHDLDQLALEACGLRTIREVFEGPGESRWREAECAALRRQLDRGPQVLSLGGGAPTRPEVAELLAGHRARGTAIVVWLDAAPEVLAARVGDHDDERPPLLADEAGRPVPPLEEARILREGREASYRAVSDVILRNEDDPASAVDRLLRPPGSG